MPPATVSEVTSSSTTAITTTSSSQVAAAALLAWPPLLLHPWAPALLPGAWCSSALRSALPGLVNLNKYILRAVFIATKQYLQHKNFFNITFYIENSNLKSSLAKEIICKKRITHCFIVVENLLIKRVLVSTTFKNYLIFFCLSIIEQTNLLHSIFRFSMLTKRTKIKTVLC